MFKRLWEYLSRNLKIAWKSVFFNFKQYIPFFVALLIVQMFYGLIAISTSYNNAIESAAINEEFSYDFKAEDMNAAQFGQIEQYFGNNVYRNSKLYTYTYDEYTNQNGDSRYDVFFTFSQKVEDAKKTFDLKCVPVLTSVSDTGEEAPELIETERYEIGKSIAANWATFGFITVILLVVSVFLMTSLYNIRINQYKFAYGVYMTFGANFRTLFGTAFWELFIISVITYIPAMLISEVVVFLIYDFPFTFSLLAFLEVALFSLVVVLAAVFMPMRVMSMRQPMSLIITEDNSNLVSSPRRSFNLLGKKFPLQYETYSIWRFRKYNLQLLTTAIVFCALFICGLYIANFYTTDVEYPRAQFTIDLSKTTDARYDDALINKLYAIDGVRIVSPTGEPAEDDEDENKDAAESDAAETDENGDAVSAETEPVRDAEETRDIPYFIESGAASDGDNVIVSSPVYEAIDLSSHILVSSKNVLPLKGLNTFKNENNKSTGVPEDGKYKVTNDAVYNAVSLRDQIDKLTEQYTFAEGSDPYAVMNGNNIIIGDSISNLKTFDFEIGSVIYIAKPNKRGQQVDSNVFGSTLLKSQLKQLGFDYTAYTVCAIITDIPSGSVPIYLNSSAYNKATGKDPTAVFLNVYTGFVNPDTKEITPLTNEQITAVEQQIKKIGYTNFDAALTVKNLRATSLQNIAKDKHYNELYVAISILILFISPLIWFFSQILYYMKREKEFNIIQSMGAVGSDIRKIYLVGGLSMAAMSLIFSIALSYIASYLIYYFYNAVLPSFTGESVRFLFDMPWYAIVTSVVLSVFCGFFSAYIPYRSYFKNRFSLQNGGSGEFGDAE